MVGRPVMDTIMKTYFARWQFKHPCERDFVGVVNEIVPKFHGTKFGKNLEWYFDQVLRGTDICDYELTAIENNRVSEPKGRFDDDGQKGDSNKEPATSAKVYASRVIVSRLGEIRLPTTVLVHFENGDEVREPWDGQGRWIDFKYRRPERISWAKVDPDTLLVIDVNLNNNSKTMDPPTAPIWKYTVKFLFWIQNILSLGSMIG
jgi:hypothetical protein